jgi:cytochrome c biogenesis protein CcmG/thiol:disulfide interchange protein DsbE
VNDGSSARGGRVVWAVIVAGALFLVLAVIFASRFGSDPSLTASPLIGAPAPEDRISLVDGGDVAIEDFAGDIVVVNFWASWCLGCRSEHDALTRAADDYAGFGTTFLAVNYQDSPSRAAAFLDELGRSDNTVYGVDEGSSTAFAWGVLGLPETFFVDRDGTVVAKVSGPVTYGLVSQTIDQIILGEVVGDITTGDVENR